MQLELFRVYITSLSACLKMESFTDIFNVVIGPSSSRTVGPMRAAYRFITGLEQQDRLPLVRKIEVTLYGALSLSRKCHNVDIALYLGLLGCRPEDVNLQERLAAVKQAERQGKLAFQTSGGSVFSLNIDIVTNHHAHPVSPYAMTFRALDDYFSLHEETWYSIAGGQVYREGDVPQPKPRDERVPFEFSSANELSNLCRNTGLSIAALMMKNELHIHTRSHIENDLNRLWSTMSQAIERGLHTEGLLPGPYKIPRRACALHKSLLMKPHNDFITTLNWVNAFALAVSEENAAGGQIVTAPTNGASGIIPAVLGYYDKFVHRLDTNLLLRFFFTACAIAILFKKNASILGSEVGCQGEIGVASSMAAAGLAELMGASTEQIFSAAEIAMEHHLGLTCDPVGGQVQIPCIERNAVSAVKAINATTMAMSRISPPSISLDEIISVMYETGKDMSAKYRETYHGCLSKIQPKSGR